VILGFTSAIPTIGGIITYLILVVVGILNFGLSYDGIRTTAVMYAVAFIVHFAETKFVTPRVLGHRIAFTSFAIITVLVASVLTFGIGRGILAGLFLLVAFKAMVELADEGRQAQGKGERDGPAAGLQPVPATVTPIAPAVSSVGAAGLAKQPPHSKRGRRRGRR
jgi:predicted PurR-regulated permease PerM